MRIMRKLTKTGENNTTKLIVCGFEFHWASLFPLSFSDQFEAMAAGQVSKKWKDHFEVTNNQNKNNPKLKCNYCGKDGIIVST